MKKIPKQAYTTAFKELAVKRGADGQAISLVVKELGLSDQTLRNWIKAAAVGELKGVASKVVTPETMDLSRLRDVCTGRNVRDTRVSISGFRAWKRGGTPHPIQ